jgi:hypothetical protein
MSLDVAQLYPNTTASVWNNYSDGDDDGDDNDDDMESDTAKDGTTTLSPTVQEDMGNLKVSSMFRDYPTPTCPNNTSTNDDGALVEKETVTTTSTHNDVVVTTTTTDSTNDMNIEVYPGVIKRLRGSVETHNAYERGDCVEIMCLLCTVRLACVLDCEGVICPLCLSMTPIDSPLFVDLDTHNNNHTTGFGTVCLGIDLDEDDDDD